MAEKEAGNSNPTEPFESVAEALHLQQSVIGIHCTYLYRIIRSILKRFDFSNLRFLQKINVCLVCMYHINLIELEVEIH
jgi:hypothetical protein